MRSLDFFGDELQLHNLSPKTIEAYYREIAELVEFFGKPLNSVTNDELKKYLFGKLDCGYSPHTVSTIINAINFSYREIYRQPFKIDILHPKRPQKVPIVLTCFEVEKLVNSYENQKHRLLILFSYVAGLRISEAVNIKISDINLQEKLLFVRAGKNKKNRYVIISEDLIDEIEVLCVGKTEHDFLFDSQQGGAITIRHAQKIFKEGLIRSGIKKKATFHTLRNSFIIHLFKKGFDVLYVQGLLGHSVVRATQRFYHLKKFS